MEAVEKKAEEDRQSAEMKSEVVKEQDMLKLEK